ncbi:hypothetical protein [uncultured Pseudodesulfovibrio sp.]|uniref:hypothetical protein n=1 Tax=uncultured Pseudodesulfovibrio sp. TaxID=2035858 RepID=UPI0029C953AB|nr:hypothetical protein [uncultured Pseudodesulfovibrio sp.]
MRTIVSYDTIASLFLRTKKGRGDSNRSPAVPVTFVTLNPEGPVVFRFPSVGVGKLQSVVLAITIIIELIFDNPGH